MLALDVDIHLAPLLQVRFLDRRRGRRGHLRNIPGGAPGQLAGQLRFVGVVGVMREGVGIGMRVGIVRPPGADIDVELAGAVFGQGLLAGALGDFDVDPDLPEGVLQGLRDLDPLLRRAHDDLEVETVGIAGLGQQRPGLLHVQRIGLILQLAQIGQRQERLMHRVLALQERVRHALVVGKILQRLANLRIGQDRVLLAHREIQDPATQIVVDGKVGVSGDRRDVLGAEVTGNIDVAALQQQALGRGLGDLAHDDAFHRRLTPVVVRVRLQRVALVRLPVDQRIGAGTGRVGPEPGIAPVAIDLVALHHLAVDDVGDRRGQAVEHKGGGVFLVGGKLEGAVVQRHQRVAQIVGGEAELGQDEGRGLFHRHGAAQREFDIAGRHRVAGCEGHAGTDLEGEDFAVAGHFPTFGDVGLVALREVIGVEADQRAVDVVGDVRPGKLEALLRVERGDVVDPGGDDENVGRGLGQRLRHRQRKRRHQGRGKRDRRKFAYQSHGVSSYFWFAARLRMPGSLTVRIGSRPSILEHCRRHPAHTPLCRHGSPPA